MNKNHEDLLTVGELARKGGVTVRTLQYYNKTGLLTPSAFSEGGRRLYGKRDILRLQQILFLKSIGFSLEDIRDNLLPTDSASELSEVFERQKNILVQQIAYIQQTVDRLDKMIKEVRQGQEIGMDRLLFIMRATRTGNPYAFMSRHMGQAQMEFIFQRFNEEDAAAFNRTLQAFSDKLVDLYRRKVQPEGAEGQQLADMWWSLMMEVTRGDKSLIPWVSSAVMHESNWPPGSEDLKQATLSFLKQAIFAYLKNNNINLS
ncbi:MerR family transcriptional regulator [Paenibacillus piri]|uniref:MerR family transcriptional regulator n=1 Tax=Paenibacillus piri TaxID=2547395 RepID=A0A4R5KHB8_9BACL|nr:MerR family transcriptional regulator [Paenibacillus piri]TDF94726.1 MerR family transcriptional regulator [Paenibacillus piri]